MCIIHDPLSFDGHTASFSADDRRAAERGAQYISSIRPAGHSWPARTLVVFSDVSPEAYDATCTTHHSRATGPAPGRSRAAHSRLPLRPGRFHLRRAQLPPGPCSRRPVRDLEKDLSGAVTPGVTGRHPLPDPERLAARFRQWGLDDDSDVVLYDAAPVPLPHGHGGCCSGSVNATASTFSMAASRRGAKPVYRWTKRSPILSQAPSAGARQQPDHRCLRASGAPRRSPTGAARRPRAAPLSRRSRTHRSDRWAYPQCHLRSVHRESQRRRPVSPGRTAAQALRTAAGQQATPAHRRLLWLRRDRLPQPVALCLAGYPLVTLYPGSWSEWITDTRRPRA